MKSPEEALKRWLQPAVFLTWSAFLAHLLAGKRYVEFLRPEFGILLALAFLIALIFMIEAIVRRKTLQTDMSSLLRALVLMMPLLYFMALPDAMLGNQAFKKRFTGSANIAISRQAPETHADRRYENNPGVAASSQTIETDRRETPLERTILELLLNPASYKGQRIKVTGMILRDEALKQHFGGRNTVVYRFLINCCAADALPLAIALDTDQTNTFTNDQWVQADGVFDLRQIDGQPVAVISTRQIKPIKTPAQPYLF